MKWSTLLVTGSRGTRVTAVQETPSDDRDITMSSDGQRRPTMSLGNRGIGRIPRIIRWICESPPAMFAGRDDDAGGARRIGDLSARRPQEDVDEGEHPNPNVVTQAPQATQLHAVSLHLRRAAAG